MSTLSTGIFLQNNEVVKTYFLPFILAFCLLLPTSLLGQKPTSKFKKGGIVQLNDSLTSYSQSDIFEFPNVNKVKYFQDARKLKALNDYPRTDDGLYQLTRDYVKNFGIENFYRNTSLLWELAKLSEKYGPKGEAVLLYKLVLKHHRDNVNEQQVQAEYDSLTKNQKENYVPLNYYNE